MIKGNVTIDRKNLISILQSCLALILVILVALMMVEIGNLKGTARVINYAGLVRGATQRAVKLEITGTRNDELIAYLDDILSDLTSGDGHYELVKLKDAAYQERLDIQRAYWERLKAEVAAARQRGYENTQIVAMSETYFEMADETTHRIVDGFQIVQVKHDAGRRLPEDLLAVGQEVEGILDSLCREADAVNRDGNQLPLSYAYGWAISADYEGCVMQTLLDKADYCMYENKRAYYATHDRRVPRS